MLHLQGPFLGGRQQSFLKKFKYLLVDPHWPWLISSRFPLLLLLVLWLEGESPGPHGGSGLRMVVLDSRLGSGVVVLDSGLGGGWWSWTPIWARG